MAACDDPRRIRHGDEDHLDCRVCDHLFEGIKGALCLWLWDQIGEGFLPVQAFVPFVEAAVWVDAECLAMPVLRGDERLVDLLLRRVRDHDELGANAVRARDVDRHAVVVAQPGVGLDSHDRGDAAADGSPNQLLSLLPIVRRKHLVDHDPVKTDERAELNHVRAVGPDADARSAILKPLEEGVLGHRTPSAEN